MLVKIENITPGMILAEDVILESGRTLLNCSAVLSENLINTLKKYGIQQLQIEAPPSQPQVAPEPKVQAPVKPPPPVKQMEVAKTAQTIKPAAPAAENFPSSLPKITITIENNGMSAFMRIEPKGGKNETFIIDDLRDALQDNGIFFGINDELLTKAVRTWQTSHEIIEIENVAVGIPAVPGKEIDLDVIVKHISNAKDLAFVKKSTYCWELAAEGIPVQRVDAGTVIAKKDFQIPGIPGKNVQGDELQSDQVVKKEINFDEYVIEDQHHESYSASITGLTYYVNGVLGVVPISFDGTAELTVSPDSMSASLIIHPAMENGNPPTEKTIRSLLVEKDITFGVNTAALTILLEQISKGIYPNAPVIIAEGLAPTNGENGTIEYCFATDTSLKPKVDSHGVADYKNVSIIQTVVKDDVVARLHPPAPGKPGKNVHGRDIPCKEGTPAILPAGANTIPKPDDDTVLIAQTDGNVRLNGHVVEIYEGFVVKGDIDYSTGNVDYDKSVSIGGDIKSGFMVKCGGDLEVNGTIEDAEIYVGGSILCRYGFIGQGKGIIDSKGDVNLGFMKNQTVRCRSNVNIAKEALNCNIFSRKAITVNGKSLSIAGGKLVARDSISCSVVGNTSGIHTLLEVGLDFTLIEELEKTAKQIFELNENRRKLLETMKRYQQILNVKKKLPPKEEFLYAKLKNTVTKYSSQVQILEERKKSIDTKMHDTSTAYIYIGQAAMPGTQFKIGERHFIVHDKIIGPKTIRSINYEIRVM